MGWYVIKNQKDGHFYFNLLADNRQIILRSEAYTTLIACKNGISSVKVNSQKPERFKREQSHAKYWFVLLAANGQIIGTSERYESHAAMENGINSVMRNGHAGAQVIDSTTNIILREYTVSIIAQHPVTKIIFEFRDVIKIPCETIDEANIWLQTNGKGYMCADGFYEGEQPVSEFIIAKLAGK